MATGTQENALVLANVKPDFDLFWSLYPKRPGNSKAAARKQWDARIRQGVAPEVMIKGTLEYRNYCKVKIDDPQFIKQASTFLGRDEHYLSDWSVKKKKASFADRLTGRSEGDSDDFIDIN